MKRASVGLILLLPTLVVMSVFTVFPLIDGIRLSFTDKHLLKEAIHFVGAKNYLKMLKDEVFWLSLLHSLILTAAAVILQLLLGLLLAWALNQDLPGIRIFRSITMASWVIPVAATTAMFTFMAQAGYGIINMLLKLVGLEELNKYWFGDKHAALPFIILLHLWRNVPFYGVAFLAAMQAIPKSYYEAAEIDGAGPWKRFLHITLPGIRNMVIVMITIHVLWTFNNFDFVFLTTGGGPVNATDVLPVYVYRQSWRSYTVGYASSIGTVMLVILMLYFIAYIRIQEKKEVRR
jgi:ABC-type sugar transport system permease subunit